MAALGRGDPRTQITRGAILSVRYVFLAAEGFPSTVYASQVADLLNVLDRAGLRFDVINFDPLYPQTMTGREGRAKVAALRAALPGKLSVRPYVPYEDRVGAPLAQRLLGLDLRRRRPTVIHARGVWAGLLAARLAERRPWIRMVYDARGDYVAEHAHHRAGAGDATSPRVRLGQWRIGRAEARVCAAATRILCVSGALRDVLERRYPGAGVKAAVVPSGFDPAKFRFDEAARRRWREQLGLEDRFLLVYAGSMVSYQCPEAIARVAALAAERRDDAHLLLLTPEVARAERAMAAGGLERARFTCQHVRHAEMPGALSAGDLGLLLRRDDPVNHVASPTKAAEYLACGVPLLLGGRIGDTSRLVAQERLGAVVHDVDDPAALGAGLARVLEAPPDRAYVAGVARQKLARDRFLPVYLDLYGQLANAARRGAASE